jgi:hypothetical protein
MKEKICRRCGILKPLSAYYKHGQMFDGHLNICIDCTKKRVSAHREINIDRIREYDRERGKLEHRLSKNSINTKKLRAENKERYRAQTYVNNAVRDGRLIKPNYCSWCGKKHSQIEGHHQDYSRKHFVDWLCSPCHKTLHLGKSKKAIEMKKYIKVPGV